MYCMEAGVSGDIDVIPFLVGRRQRLVSALVVTTRRGAPWIIETALFCALLL